MKETQADRIQLLAQELLVDCLKEKREAVLGCKGFSMHPVLKEGDKIFFRDSRNVSFGDLVVYYQEGNIIVHRFIRKTRIQSGTHFLLKADNSRSYDQPVSSAQILGIVTKFKRGNKIINVNSFSGRLKSLLYFALSSIRLLGQKNNYQKIPYNFISERKILSMLADDLTNDPRAAWIKILESDLNWDYLAEKIKWNFISPFFIQKFVNLNLKDFVPLKYWEKLENNFQEQILHDTKSRQVLNKVLVAFNNQGIDALVLKGAQLGVEVYRESCQRRMGDIDLLVRRQDWLAAWELLVGLGFLVTETPRKFDNWGIKFLDSHIDFMQDGIKLELKSGVWAIDFPYFNYTLWKTARKAPVENQEVYWPSCEDTLLLACVNLYRHDFLGLIWFMDIKRIIEKYRGWLDWAKFFKKAQDYDLKTVVFYALYFTQELLSLGLPVRLLIRLRPGIFSRALFNFFWDQKAILLKKEGAVFRAKIPFEFSLVLFSGKFSFRPAKLKSYLGYFLRLIFPPQSYLKVRYGRNNKTSLLFNYYILRLKTLILVFWYFTFRLITEKRDDLFKQLLYKRWD